MDLIPVTKRGRIEPGEIQPTDEVLWLKPKMKFGDKQAIKNVVMRGTLQADQSVAVQTYVGDSETISLVRNIVQWQGGRFQGKRVSQEAIEDLEGDTTIFDKALEVINQLNPASTLDEPLPNPTSQAPTLTLVGPPSEAPSAGNGMSAGVGQ